MEVFQILVLIFVGIFSVRAEVDLNLKVKPIEEVINNVHTGNAPENPRLLTTPLRKVADLNLNLKSLEESSADFERQLAQVEAANLTVAELIEAEGYPVEVHSLTTTDGYILTIHRVPTGKNGETNGKVAYVQHGVLCSSADWIIAGSEKGLGYILADAGYDVWMGNARGNTQSRKHISLDPDKDSEFWQFSWHEIGTIDVPQMIDYVMQQTGIDGVHYVGHSQGTTTFYVMTSILPEYNAKIKVSVSLAPIAYMNHMTSPLLKIIALWNTPLGALTSLIGANEFLPQTAFIDFLSDTLCSSNSVTQTLCSNALFAICGFSADQMNGTLLPLLMRYSPAGASTKQILHYGQEIVSGHFRQYDFGAIKNMITYNSLVPPDYPLDQITAPVHLIYSHNDWLAAEVDVEKLCNELGNCQALTLVSDSSFNHMDYLFGIDAKDLVYENVVSIFNAH